MEEPTYDYDWRHPITVPNPKNKSGVSVEKGSFKWFEYWLKNECTFKDVAIYFKTSEENIRGIAKLFKWRERKSNRDDFISRQREKQIISDYADFLEQTQKETDEEIQLIRAAILDLSIKLGVKENPETGEKEPDYKIDYVKGIKAYGSLVNSLGRLRAMRYRSLEQPDKRTDKQETEITSGKFDIEVKSEATVNLLDKVKQKRKELNDLNSN